MEKKDFQNNSLEGEINISKDDEKNSKWIDNSCLLYTSPSPRDRVRSRMPSSA